MIRHTIKAILLERDGDEVLVKDFAYLPHAKPLTTPEIDVTEVTRLTLQQHLLKLWENLRNTVVFVTHDLVEAIALSDLIVVFSPRPGRILEVVKVPLPRPRDVLTVYDYDGFQQLHAPLQRMHQRVEQRQIGVCGRHAPAIGGLRKLR